MMIRRIQCLAAGLALVTALGGCSGDPDKLSAVPAAGTVTFKGKPLELGNIQFMPEKGRTAVGAIKDGKFTLTTYVDNDGAVPGKHTVVITAYKEAKDPSSTEPVQVLITPEKYANAASSGLTYEVPSGGKQDIVIDMQP